MYCKNFLFLSVFLIFSTSGAFAQIDFQQEIEKEISRDPNGKFLYDHSDAYKNRIESRLRKRILNQKPDEILGTTFGKDIFSDANDQNETTIAINRKNPDLIIAGSNDGAEGSLQMPVYITKDGGLSWHTVRLPTLPDDRLAGGDPMIAAGDDGRFYYAFLTNPKYASLPIQLVVATSLDGENWTDMQPVGVQKAERSFQDKPTITVDNSPLSPFYGRVYLVWTLSTDDKPYEGLRISWSDDAGKSWSPAKVLTTEINNIFAQLCTGKYGEILVSYSSLDDSLHEILISKDGGNTFVNLVIEKFTPFPLNIDNRPSLKGFYGFRAYPYPAMREDFSNNRIHLVYGTWKVWSSTDSSSELLYTYSDDMGLKWSSPIAAGISENISLIHRDHFFPWLSYDEYTHQTSLVYYSSENDPNNTKTTIYRRLIIGNSLSNVTAIGDSLFNPLYQALPSHSVPAFIGDYIGCDTYKNKFASAWTQNRPNNADGDVYAFVGVTDSLVSGVNSTFGIKINSNKLWLSNAFPNPSHDRHIFVNFTIPESGNIRLDIFSTSGDLIQQIFHRDELIGSYTENLDTSGLPAGSYILRLSIQNQSVETLLTIL